MYIIPIHAIQRLLCFENLVEVEIHSPFGFDLNDNLCDQMARAWPRAERLEFREFYEPDNQPAVTLQYLHSFAQHCPLLKHLHITFNARLVPAQQPSPPASQGTLHLLGVGYSKIDHAVCRRVGEFISALFPALRQIYTAQDGPYRNEHPPPPFAYHRRWKDVQDVLCGK
ncbi:hypothetical protein B0H13DRAFT_1619956 [Mycena leptocephala]|nr:hypothetical protein B0H13DRAFT_1619956 [Mycena leptocephala]